MSEGLYRILIVEDEEGIRNSIRLNLKMEGYHPVLAKDGAEALEKIRTQRFDLVLLDVQLPEIDGFTICKTMRLEGNRTPVLFLTARRRPLDRVEGLKIGGDDYLIKPFLLEELLLRIQKLIQRNDDSHRTLADLDHYSFGPNKVNFRTFRIVDKSGVERQLSKKEMMLLKLLIQKKGEVVSREEILETVWGYNVFPSTRTIDNYILAFRKYFEDNARLPKYFHSVRGVGYKFEN